MTLEEYTASSRKRQLLQYDRDKWQEVGSIPVNTLQLFITNKCNLRCRGCFYSNRLGKDEMSFEEYKDYIKSYGSQVQKVILLGGEPTIHPELEQMLKLNQDRELKTTIYTNGFNLKRLESLDLDRVSVRLGVYGLENSEKPLSRICRTTLPIEIVYMLRRDNTQELLKTAIAAEKDFNCRGFYISSIREIDKTGSFWLDTKETLPIEQYAQFIQGFVKEYEGNIHKLHIARRGVLYTKTRDETKTANKCRFGNIFPDSKKVICPFDISRNITSPELKFNQRTCNKHSECILQKIVLQRK